MELLSIRHRLVRMERQMDIETLRTLAICRKIDEALDRDLGLNRSAPTGAAGSVTSSPGRVAKMSFPPVRNG